jgi:hypothetical protein
MRWYYGPHTHIYAPFPIFNTPIQKLRSSIFHTICGTRILILSSTHQHLHFSILHTKPQGPLLAPQSHRYTCFLFINHQIIVICSFLSDIFHVGYLVFVCTGTYHVHQSSLQSWPPYGPFRYMFKTGMHSHPLQTTAYPSYTPQHLPLGSPHLALWYHHLHCIQVLSTSSILTSMSCPTYIYPLAY